MPEVTGTIQSDVQMELRDDDPNVDAFLKDIQGEPQTPPKDDAEAPTDEPNETGEPEGDDTPSEPKVDPNDPDEQEFEVKVGEETHKPKLKELKRLFGQEAALTRKSQQATEMLNQATQREQFAKTALTTLLERAETRAKQYADLDMLVLAQRMPTEEFQALREDAANAQKEVTFLKDEIGQHVQQAQQRHQQAYREAAQACLKELTDPEKGIKGWNEDLYKTLTGWATEHGAPAARDIVDPAVWKILNMAYAYDQHLKAVASAEAKAKKVHQKPSTTITPKGGRAEKPTDTKATAIRNLRHSGSLDDATAAFMAK